MFHRVCPHHTLTGSHNPTQCLVSTPSITPVEIHLHQTVFGKLLATIGPHSLSSLPPIFLLLRSSNLIPTNQVAFASSPSSNTPRQIQNTNFLHAKQSLLSLCLSQTLPCKNVPMSNPKTTSHSFPQQAKSLARPETAMATLREERILIICHVEPNTTIVLERETKER